MSATVEKRVVPPGSDDYVDQAWELKERIREEEGFLQQRHGFFSDAYRRSTVHAFVDADDQLVGFAAARRDGYILFLAVAEEYRGEGFGERLVAEVADDSRRVTCHARTTNENAIAFYEHLGFTVERRIENYYEDGGAAFYLRLGDESRLRDRLSEIFRR
ncbi:GNAT family N-acetyltransferase [Halobacteriaceae archaeon GCM10025711]